MNRTFRVGFTVVEVTIVIVVIAILATVAIVGYNGITVNARDKVLLSDIDAVEGEIGRYAAKNAGVYGAALNWDSSTGSNANIVFTPSNGNIIKVVGFGDGYCIKGYNPKSSNKTLATARQKGSDSSACQPGLITVGGTSCANSKDMVALCWGSNFYGGLGNTSVSMGDSNSQSPVPIPVDTTGVLANKTIKQFAGSGINTNCAIASDDLAYCWGSGGSGQLGNGSSTNSNVPVAVTTSGALSGKTVKYIAVGQNNGCVIASDSKIYCWGSNYSGQLGDNTTTSSTVPVAVNATGVLAGKTMTSVAIGANYACALDSDGKVYCWGKYQNWATGPTVPVAVTTGALSGKVVKKLALGGGGASYACSLDTEGSVACWGVGYYGEMGTGVAMVSSGVPTRILDGAMAGQTVKDISASGSLTCAVSSGKRAYCWGYNSMGQLGDGTTTAKYVPTAVSTAGAMMGKDIASVISYGSGYAACAIDTLGQLYCWGNYGTGGGPNTLPTAITLPL